MAQVQLPTSLKKVLMMTMVLVFLSTSAIIIGGQSLKAVQHDIKILNKFLENSEEIQPNFERSLEMYTDQTKNIIDFLSNLRPQTEEALVAALSEIEVIGQNLNLNIDFSSLSNDANNANGTGNSIPYSISFYGDSLDLHNFLQQLEALPYFIKVKNIDYREIKFLDSGELGKSENINIRIELYIK